jgi:hypothetical protein
MASIDALVDLLKATNPPTIPAPIDVLATLEYAQVALTYIDGHPSRTPSMLISLVNSLLDGPPRRN